LTLLAFPPPARADIWDWLSEFSGPGPFHANYKNSFPPNTLVTLCPGNGDVNGRPHTTITGDGGKIPCVYVDFRNLINSPDQKGGEDNFPNQVKIVAYDFGVAFDLEHRIQVGAGAGFMHFNSQDTVHPGQSVVRNRFDITLFRLTAQPLQFIPVHAGRDGWKQGWKNGWKDNKYAGLLKFYVKYTVVPGDLDGSDFGIPTSTFSASNDVLFSRGFFVDFGELFRRR
jgi:hypothetical protein